MNKINLCEYNNIILEKIKDLNKIFDFLIGKYFAHRSPFTGLLIYLGKVKSISIYEYPKIDEKFNMRLFLDYVHDDGEEHSVVLGCSEFLYTDDIEEVNQWKLEMELQK